MREEESMFNTYTQKSCLFECALKKAMLDDNCIPWDYPFPPNANTPPICTMSSHDNGRWLVNFHMVPSINDARKILAFSDPLSVKT